MKTFQTHSAEETTDLGRQLAAELKPGSVVLLRGDLGAGKTTLVKGIAEGFNAAEAEAVTRDVPRRRNRGNACCETNTRS